VLVGAVAAIAAWPAGASAEPAEFAHGSIEQTLSSTTPNSPTGFHFVGRYHAAGDPSSPPPYMRKMTFYDPTGSHLDTSVPELCTASDVELAVSGASACPEGSRIGGGKSETLFMNSFPTTVEVEVFNNTGEQVMLARSPILTTVTRGKIRPDGSVEYASPTCFPSTAGCPGDNVLQLTSDISSAPYVKGGRAYQTTPAKCPKSGRWESHVRLWWADGTEDAVTTTTPCTAPKPAKPAKRKRKRTKKHR
jgi:hypothetical protein